MFIPNSPNPPSGMAHKEGRLKAVAAPPIAPPIVSQSVTAGRRRRNGPFGRCTGVEKGRTKTREHERFWFSLLKKAVLSIRLDHRTERNLVLCEETEWHRRKASREESCTTRSRTA